MFDRSSGRIPEDKSADGSPEDADRSVPVLYADFSEREEDALRPGAVRLLLLPAHAPQEPQPADAAPAVLPVRAAEGRFPPVAVGARADGSRRASGGRGAPRRGSRDVAGLASVRSRDHVLS